MVLLISSASLAPVAAVGSAVDPAPDQAAGAALGGEAAEDLPGSPFRLHDGVIVNLRPFNTDFSALEPWIDGISAVRVWGGSRGMATYPTADAVPEVLLEGPSSRWNVVTQEEIDALVDLQERHGVSVIYMMSINDTLESQTAFVHRLLDNGLDLVMLEMGNEIYLRKFREGDVGGLGVTRKILAEDYVELLEEWVPALRAEFGLPIYVVGASHSGTQSGGDQHRQHWNHVVRAALDADPTLTDGVTFHRYAGEGRHAPEDEEEITLGGFGFLEDLGDRPIAITESGYRMLEETPENLAAAQVFWDGFVDRLGPADAYGVHVMFGPPGRVGDIGYALFREEGRTPVGDRFDAWLRWRGIGPAQPWWCDEPLDRLFSDVPRGHPFCRPIEAMGGDGVVAGYADGTFRPGGVVTRQAMAAFLWRLAGEPSVDPGEAPIGARGGFVDVPPSHPFAEPIAWLAATGATTGTVSADGTARFDPAAPVSRQALATFLWRLAGEPSTPAGEAPLGGAFVDVSPSHPFGEPIAWLAASGLAQGFEDGSFRPTAAVSRQAAVAILDRQRQGD
ncbi:MAG: S-layer homology domain-containing protein [Acidimicrobiia bacterium]|nr:S-layer homology domain-containing protein [Acidimicrobiia bacterium]